MTPWDKAWSAAKVAERKIVRYWKPGFSKDPHRNGMRGERNQCSECGELFNSSSAFEKHRTGDFGKPGVRSKRRCFTIEEMKAKGFLKNEPGFWITGTNPLYGNASISRAQHDISDD